MFGAKAKKIHELKLGMEGFRRQMNEWQNAAAKFQVKAEELEAGLKFVNSANSALLAERDQFAKEVDRLQNDYKICDEDRLRLSREVTDLKNKLEGIESDMQDAS